MSSEATRFKKFFFYFTQRYVEIRGGYDLMNEDIFKGISQKYYGYSKRIPEDDFQAFLATITESELKGNEYQWGVSVSKFFSGKYPSEEKEEDVPIKASDYSRGIVQIMCQRFPELEDEEKPVARALLMRRLCGNMGKVFISFWENKLRGVPDTTIIRITKMLDRYKFTKHERSKNGYEVQPMKMVDALSMKGKP